MISLRSASSQLIARRLLKTGWIAALLFCVTCCFAFAGEKTVGGEASSLPKVASNILVTNTNDNGPGSLRQALAIANDGDTSDDTGPA